MAVTLDAEMIVEEIYSDANVNAAIVEAYSLVMALVKQDYRPALHLPNYFGCRIAQEIPRYLTTALGPYGVDRVDDQGQYRLSVPQRFAIPVVLLTCSGEPSGGYNFKVNKKGAATDGLMVWDDQACRRSMQLSLFDEDQQVSNNIDCFYIVYQFSGHKMPMLRYRLFLAHPVEISSTGSELICDYAKLIYSGSVPNQEPLVAEADHVVVSASPGVNLPASVNVTVDLIDLGID